jgi:hypothetical protein
MDAAEVGIFNVLAKPLPFRKQMNKVDNATYAIIETVLKKATLKKYVIDDANYLMSYELFDKVAVTGYSKFTEIAVHFKNLIDTVIRSTPADCIVYFMMHTDESEQGVKAKTVGKMLDSTYCVEGVFSIVLRAKGENGKYIFATQTDGTDVTKSPAGMLDKEEDNDLDVIDKKIRAYWNIDKIDKKDGK